MSTNNQPIAIMGTPGYVRHPIRFDDDTMLQVLGQNSGNLMFQYAAAQIIDAPQVHISLAETSYSDRKALEGISYLVFPAANHLRLGADWTGLNGYLSSVKCPLVIMGLGAQSPKVDGELETIQALKKDKHVCRLVDILRDKAAFVSVRGAYSQKVCAELGLDNVHVLGCPSALISPELNLGVSLEKKMATSQAAVDRTTFAVTAAAPFEISDDSRKLALERKLFAWLYSNNGVYVQQSGGVAAMNLANGMMYKNTENANKSMARILAPDLEQSSFEVFLRSNGRFFLSVIDWMLEMKGLDFSIGTRLHGNMAAIASGIPGILIAHDSRTSELGETMNLPQISLDDVLASENLLDAIDKVSFDGRAFDTWRRNTALELTVAFDKLNIPLAEHVKALGGNSPLNNDGQK
ncbi:MAG: polysaccharide pyruvyl transferase family protein [gamma proteobacterium endosymbiont of Lamellibrachia anaximandri]|nr:polysaccharide pyruvyl transferase family protein [gamma proteobacterium endosymbiont of Lamellibrachia anaximandri]MBL3534073.1 polysaccharide pyruvyl transferase family protein [gamma proteobacterium endosymbiont of Lamellibrachia anaximandri]